jgi:tetratricopeptide (TPR) repeat protein
MPAIHFAQKQILLPIGIIVSLLLIWGCVAGMAQPVEDLVFPDYAQRDMIIQSYEEQLRQTPDSFLSLQLLAAQYLRRFRERADLEDLQRVEVAAHRSLALQPQNNTTAELLLSSTLLSQHRFQEAAMVISQSHQRNPQAATVATLNGSIQMELGNYEVAQSLLKVQSNDAGQGAVIARYLELTGHLDQARSQLDSAMQEVDRFYTNPAETRAWFHVRSGDLAFAAGDLRVAEQRYREALKLFPSDIAAFTGLSRLYASQHRWQAALAAANQGIEQVPLVETLGYKADAQRALGDPNGAADTEAMIDVVAQLSQVKGIYDRALAIYYIEHDTHLPEALAIARREVQIRDDIYAEDTLAWAAAANEQWQEAEDAAQRSGRYSTEDALLQYHQGVIAQQCGHPESAIKHLQKALHQNPQFHPRYSEDARVRLSQLIQLPVED